MTDIGRLEISEDVFERFGVMASENADSYAIVNGIVVVPKNAVIPDGTVI